MPAFAKEYRVGMGEGIMSGGIAKRVRMSTKFAMVLGAVSCLALAGTSFGQDSPQQPKQTQVSNPCAAIPPLQQASASAGDSLALKIVAAGLGGFLAWLLTKIVGLLILRMKLVSYLLVVINAHLRIYHDTENWVFAVREKTIKEGHVIKLAASYTKDDLGDFTEVRQDCLRLLSQRELEGITKLLQCMWEIEALYDGFCGSLEGYRSRGVALDASDVEYLQRKQDRILSYIHVLPSEVGRLSELRLDYRGIHGAETLVTSSSARLPTS